MKRTLYRRANSQFCVLALIGIFQLVLSLSSVEADTNDAINLRNVIVAKCIALYQPVSVVLTNYSIISVTTNGSALAVYASNVCGTGTTGLFSYAFATNTALPSDVQCVSNNLSYFSVDFQNGQLMAYREYTNGIPSGVYIDFYSNGQAKLMSSLSNGCLVGSDYYFDVSGFITNVVVYTNPVALLPSLVCPQH